MQDDDIDYWFPAKRYGWGWGPPITWQGWAVFAGFMALMLAGAATLLSRHLTSDFILYAIALSVALVAICWWKGEPPHWRWGGE